VAWPDLHAMTGLIVATERTITPELMEILEALALQKPVGFARIVMAPTGDSTRAQEN
jgi:hypothetical protein